MKDDKFLEELKKVENLMMYFATKFTSDTDAARELCQDSIVNAYIKRHTFIENSNFKLWILTILRNNYINKEKYKAKFVDSYKNIDDRNRDCNNNDYTDYHLTMNDINSVMDKLSMTYYIPLNMFLAGYKYNEISTMLQLPLSTVKNRIHYARERLRVMLKDYKK